MIDKYQVLIVEDDFRVANIWKEFTQSLPEYFVNGIANNGELALSHLNENDIDLLIMDVYMPDIDGVQMLHEIRRLRYPLDVIVITAAKEAKIIQRIMRLGVLDYIIKPCGLERFQISLARYKQVRATFEKDELEQTQLNELLHWKVGTIGESRELPKGMQKLTLKKVLQCFEQNPYARSAEEIARSTGLSLATIQRYLRYLAESNLVKKELIYGSQGRPEHKYSKS